jgi:hypothetical protein
MLKTSPTAIKGTLQRGRAALDGSRNTTERRPPQSAEEHDLARRFANAYVAADIDGVLTLLTDDSWLSMPPGATPVPRLGCDSGIPRGQLRLPWRAQCLPDTRPSEQPAIICQLHE